MEELTWLPPHADKIPPLKNHALFLFSGIWQNGVYPCHRHVVMDTGATCDGSRVHGYTIQGVASLRSGSNFFIITSSIYRTRLICPWNMSGLQRSITTFSPWVGNSRGYLFNLLRGTNFLSLIPFLLSCCLNLGGPLTTTELTMETSIGGMGHLCLLTVPQQHPQQPTNHHQSGQATPGAIV